MVALVLAFPADWEDLFDLLLPLLPPELLLFDAARAEKPSARAMTRAAADNNFALCFIFLALLIFLFSEGFLKIIFIFEP